MAYTIKLGTFAKKENSTAQPDTTGWAFYDINFKQGSNFMAPSFTLSLDFETAQSYNYAELFGKYYWVKSLDVVRADYVEFTLEIDVLATYKAEIGDADLYILRSSAEYDGAITDNYYTSTAGKTFYSQLQDLSAVPIGLGQEGFIVLNVVGTGSVGTATWQFTRSQFNTLLTKLYTSIDGIQGGDFLERLGQWFGGNPIDLINNALWFPYPFETTGTDLIVSIGAWTADTAGSTPAYGRRVSNLYQQLDGVRFNVREHPLSASKGKYLNLYPYRVSTLFIPGCGAVNIDTTLLEGAKTIRLERSTEALTGAYKVYVYADVDNDYSRLLATLNGQWGVPIALNGVSKASEVAGGISSSIGAAASGMIAGNVMGAVIGAASGIGSSFGAIAGASISTGPLGGALNITDPIRLDDTFFNIVDEDNTNNGRPLCAIRKPKNIPGYMIAQKSPIAIRAELEEISKIERYLTSGFYYE